MMLNFSQTGTVDLTMQMQSGIWERNKRVERVGLIEKGKNHCRDAEQDMMKTEEMLLEELREQEQLEFVHYLTKAYKQAQRTENRFLHHL